jgi:putative transposase
MARQTVALQLTHGERQEVRGLLKNGVLPVRSVVRALALLRLDAGVSAPQVATMLEMTGEGVRKIARRYQQSGWEAAVFEGPRPGKKPALDDGQKQKVVALACSQPPAGHARWTIRLLTAEIQKRKIVPGVGRESIRIALQDHDLKPWREKNVVRGGD